MCDSGCAGGPRGKPIGARHPVQGWLRDSPNKVHMDAYSEADMVGLCD